MMEKLKKIKYGFISMRRTAGMISLCFIKNMVTGDEIWLQIWIRCILVQIFRTIITNKKLNFLRKGAKNL